MKKLFGLLLTLAFVVSLHGQVQLPDSLRLAGPLAAGSEFGDEFFNFPDFFGGKAEPGSTFLSGWIEIRFSQPKGGFADFTLLFDSVGTPDGIVFPGGQFYRLNDNKAFTNPAFVSKGRLNMTTGEVEDFELHALFQNSVISKVTRNIRIPFGFINDYPPASLPLDLPFDDRPAVFADAEFQIDSSGQIVGFEFHGETIAPVTLFPLLGIFPPYSFGDDDGFYFANPDGCVPGTPEENCPNDETNPDGIRLADNAFFHPHLDLISVELREASDMDIAEPCLPAPLSSGNGMVAVDGILYHLGGSGPSGLSAQVRALDGGEWLPATTLPNPVAGAQSASVGSKIFVVGGTNDDGSSSSRVQILDTATLEWSLGESTPYPVYGGTATSVEGLIFIIGGWADRLAGGVAPTGIVQIYDPDSDSWKLGNSAPVAVAGASAVSVGQAIYLINGLREDGFATSEVWLYDTVSDSWSEGAQTRVAVYDAVAACMDGRIYLAGGRSREDGPTLDVLQLVELDGGEWRKGLSLPIATGGSSGAVLEGKLYLAGGRTMVGLDEAPGAATDVSQGYDPGAGWSTCDSHPLFASVDVMNAASGVVGPVDLSPGSRAVILGYNFSEDSRSAPLIRSGAEGFTTDLPTRLEGISVLVDGMPSPVLSVEPGRIEFQIPYRVRASSSFQRMVPLQVLKDDPQGKSAPVMIPLMAASPGVYTYNFGEYRNEVYLDGATAQARNSDGTVNHPSRPAAPGEIVSLLANGLGLVSPVPDLGERAGQDPRNEAVIQPEVTIGGLEAEVISTTLWPREIGIYELKVKIPENSPRANNVLVRVTAAGIGSNRASISVR
jgi:uncharacterized protein (TIGR03437 family)